MSLSLLIEQATPWALPESLKVDFNLSTPESIDIGNRIKLPNCSGIYFVTSGDKLLYIGKADRNLRQRWSCHHRCRQFFELPAVKIFYCVLESPLRVLELLLIDALKPGLNGTAVEKRIEDDGAIDFEDHSSSIFGHIEGDPALVAKHCGLTWEEMLVFDSPIMPEQMDYSIYGEG